MTILVHPHALRHGLNVEQITSAFETRSGSARVRQRDTDREPPRWAAVGFDQQARPIEIVYVETASGDPLVFHANYLTQGFLTEWRQA
jgi:uncharacterized DUF497 family protein